MTARGVAPGVDPVRIHVELPGAVPEPAHGGLRVVQLRREMSRPAEPVVRGNHNEPRVCEPPERAEPHAVQHRAERGTLPHPPAAAVEVHDRGEPLR